MKFLAFILTLGLMISISSCKKDIIGDENVEEVITTTPTITQIISTDVSGIVTDNNGIPLPNVTITYSREAYTTDENGYFIIKGIKADVEGGVLYLSAEGHFDNFKFFLPEVNETSFVRVRMIARNNPDSFNSAEGGTIDVTGGGSIVFPQNAIKVESSNQAYNGNVNVYTHWYNPKDPFLGQSMPGDLRALSLEGQIVQLSTYGMMAVELRSDNNEKLNLADESFADIKFPLPQNIRSHAPEIIETWSLNEQTVYWEEESIAESDGEFYYARVSHFSFWNCDVPFPLVNITGKLINQDGLPLSYYSICIDVVSNGRTGFGWTNSAGTFKGKVPKNEALVLKVKNECGEVVLERNIGPFSNDASFGEIEINLTSQAIITGRLICNGNPVTNGYARICINDITCYIAEVDGQGNFTQAVISCNTVDGITIQGFDTGNATISELQSIDINNGSASVILETCDELPEYIIFKVNNGQEVLITDPSASFTNGDLQISGASDSIETGLYVEISSPSLNGPNNVNVIEGLYFDFLSSDFYEFFCQDNDCSDVNFEFTTLGTMEGELVIGTYMGEIDGEVIMGSFKINIDELVEFLDCTTEVINNGDCNDDSSIEISINGGTPPYQVNYNGNSQGDINNNTFIINGLTAGEVIEYTVTDANGLECQGRESIPNSLTCSISASDASCGSSNGTASASVSGGSGSYSYEWNNGATTAQITGLAAGSYTVFITDNCWDTNGNGINDPAEDTNGDGVFNSADCQGPICTTTCSVTVGETGGLDVFIFTQDSILCNPDNSLVIADVAGGTLPYSYLWSDNSTDNSIEGLGSGIYSVTVTDQNGCTGEDIKNIEFLMGDLFVEVRSSIVGCSPDGFPFGTLSALSTFGGQPPYQYLWTNANTTVMSESVDLNYQESINLIVTDNSGCIFTEEYTFNPDNFRNISGRVWEDSGTSDNIYDFNDVFLEEIEVRLYDSNDLNNPTATAFTNANNGRYIFEDVEEGSYVIQVIAPSDEYSFVETNVGQNDNIDNEFNADGFSEIIEFDGCIGIEFFSAGLSL